MARPKKNSENLLPVKAGVDQVTYLASLTENCTAADYGAIVARLKDIAITGDPKDSVRSAKILLDTFMQLAMAFPPQQHPEEEGRRAGKVAHATLDRLMDALDEANRSVPMTTVGAEPTS